jgi:hypothetical protein
VQDGYLIQRADLASVTEPVPPEEPASGGTIEEVLHNCLRAGEAVWNMASALWRATNDRFEETAVLLTNQRLLIVASSPEGGFELRSAMERTVCSVLSYEEKDDGGTLMLIRQSPGVLCMYFASPWRREAAAIRSELGMAASVQTLERPIAAGQSGPVDVRPMAKAPVHAGSVDRFTLSQEFAGISRSQEDEDD